MSEGENDQIDPMVFRNQGSSAITTRKKKRPSLWAARASESREFDQEDQTEKRNCRHRASQPGIAQHRFNISVPTKRLCPGENILRVVDHRHERNTVRTPHDENGHRQKPGAVVFPLLSFHTLYLPTVRRVCFFLRGKKSGVARGHGTSSGRRAYSVPLRELRNFIAAKIFKLSRRPAFRHRGLI